MQWSPRQGAEDNDSSTAVPAGAFQYLQREREGRQESPLGHCPVKRPNRRIYQISDREMHTPHRSNKPTREHGETCAPLPFPHGFSLTWQEHKNAQKRNKARARMLGKGHLFPHQLWQGPYHQKNSCALQSATLSTWTKQGILAVTMLCVPAESRWGHVIKSGYLRSVWKCKVPWCVLNSKPDSSNSLVLKTWLGSEEHGRG